MTTGGVSFGTRTSPRHDRPGCEGRDDLRHRGRRAGAPGRVARLLDHVRGALRAPRVDAGSNGLPTNAARRPALFLANRFAAKEAFSKAMGTGFRFPVTLGQISVHAGSGGANRSCSYRPDLRTSWSDSRAASSAHHVTISDEQERGLRGGRPGARMSAIPLALGPILVGIDGPALSQRDQERLLHPLTGGVVLFARNFSDPTQLAALCASIRALREPRLLIAVDHEGGRVQRFRTGFTAIPAMRTIGAYWQSNRTQCCSAAWSAGFVTALELRSCGVDLAFAPVLDVDHGESTIIGDRAFHRDPTVIIELASHWIDGARAGGMAAVGKHFPGHGFIAADSHLELPVDPRPFPEIQACDLVPFQALAARLAGIMPAHVVYPAVDTKPAGFSEIWLRRILRQELAFHGIVLSDDLGMEGAAIAGDLVGRARAAFAGGCDLVLACTVDNADELLANFVCSSEPHPQSRLAPLFGELSWTTKPMHGMGAHVMFRR
jgi:beta-N-acetylhexosaminidase